MVRAALLVVVLALPACACLNDSEIARAEGEFRARYAGGPTAAASGSRAVVIGVALALGLAGGGLGVLWWRRSRAA